MAHDQYLWWITLITGCSAAVLSLWVTSLDRRQVDWPTRAQRFKMHIAAYVILSISVLAFVARGLLGLA